MNNRILLTLALGLLGSSMLFGSPEQAQIFLESAKKGSYEDMVRQVKKGLISGTDVLNTRDANGNTLILAAIQGYPAAVKKYKDRDEVASYLNKIIMGNSGLLTLVPKDKATEALVNTQNNDGLTALALLAKLGVNKMLIYGALRSRGALAITPDGKKASDAVSDATKKSITNMLRAWEKFETDNKNWSPIGQAFETFGEKFKDFGDKVKEFFGGEQSQESASSEEEGQGDLTSKITGAAGSLFGSKSE